MKLNLSIFFTFFFIACNCFSQNKDIEIINTKNNDDVVFSVKNNMSERKEVTLTINGTGFSNFQSPITKTVNKNELLEFTVLNPIKGKPYKYSSSYTYISKPTDEEITIKNKKLEENSVGVNEDLTKGIVVFAKDGCPRCDLTLNYLNDNNIKFKYLNTTKSQEVNKLMWLKLKENKVTDRITMPVIIVNGKLSHSHKDLTAFIKQLK